MPLRAWLSRPESGGLAGMAGVVMVGAAVLIAAAVALRGIAGPFPNGHFASSAAIGMCADNMWRWSTFLPLNGYREHLGVAPNYYMHHPLGVFWTIALMAKVLGFHDWVMRLPPLLYVTVTPLFLYRIARGLWGPIEGGLCALAYVALPITLGYANYHDLEQPYILGIVVSTWGYLRYVSTWRERYAVASIAALFFALNQSWWSYLWAACFLGMLFVRAYLVPEQLFGTLRPRPFARYWALMCFACVAALGLELVLLNTSGRVSDVLTSVSVRRGDALRPLSVVLTARRYRIELMFTGLAILLGKIAAPLIVARAALKRSDLELLPLPMLLAAMVHYLVFKQGADIHIFWPHPFAPYFALAVGALAASAREALAWAAPKLPRALGRIARHAAPAALLLVGVPVLFVLRDGLSLIRLARETGGRFAEANLDSEIDKSVALRWFLARIPPTATVAFHPGFYASWALQWEARPRPVLPDQGVSGSPASARVYVLDSRGASPFDLKTLVGRFHVDAVGPLWLVDRTQPAAPLDGYSFAQHEPSWRERWSLGDVEPVRVVRPDPWITWEWRTALGQPATAPTGAPATDEQLRIAHNVALAAGDTKRAAALRAALAAGFNLPLKAKYANGTELLGAVHARGAQPTVTFYFLAGRFDRDAHFAVQAKVIAPPRLSTLPVDPASLDLARPPMIPTTLWKAGHLYAIPVVYRKRPGTEQLTGAWSPPVARSDGARDPLQILQIR